MPYVTARAGPIRLHLTEGQTSQFKAAAILVTALPPASALLADRAYDARWFRQALAERDIQACIPPHRSGKVQHPYDRQPYKMRHKIENMFARLKDWRKIHNRYERCAHTFLSPITFAPIFICWINEAGA